MTHDANDVSLGISPSARARTIREIPDPASHASLRHCDVPGARNGYCTCPTREDVDGE